MECKLINVVGGVVAFFLIFFAGFFMVDDSFLGANFIKASEVQKTFISSVSGNVTVNDVSVSQGVMLQEGDSIKTGKNGEAVIIFFDKSVSRIAQNSEVILMDLEGDSVIKSDVSISLIAGTVWSKVMKVVSPESQFSVQAGQVIAAVRGSALNVSLNESTNTAKVEAIEHSIRLSLVDTSGNVFLSEQTISEGLRAHIPQKMSKKERKDQAQKILLKKTKKVDTVAPLQKKEVRKKEVLLPEVMVEKIPESEKKTDWMQKNLAEDEKYSQEIKEKRAQEEKKKTGILPDSSFYKIKELKDSVRRSLVTSEDQKVQLDLEIAARKVLEAKIVSQKSENNERSQEIKKEAIEEMESLVEEIATLPEHISGRSEINFTNNSC